MEVNVQENLPKEFHYVITVIDFEIKNYIFVFKCSLILQV